MTVSSTGCPVMLWQLQGCGKLALFDRAALQQHWGTATTTAWCLRARSARNAAPAPTVAELSRTRLSCVHSHSAGCMTTCRLWRPLRGQRASNRSSIPGWWMASCTPSCCGAPSSGTPCSSKHRHSLAHCMAQHCVNAAFGQLDNMSQKVHKSPASCNLTSPQSAPAIWDRCCVSACFWPAEQGAHIESSTAPKGRRHLPDGPLS